ncbi:hypothetical protein AHF37_08405 [Paragonimus kellicotti]|nr:hypothetical protein AHF37_08405 [Paragonimus kellicotti]
MYNHPDRGDYKSPAELSPKRAINVADRCSTSRTLLFTPLLMPTTLVLLTGT